MINEPIAFLFPGQGAQYAGMGKDLYDTYPEAKQTYDEADRLLGFSISKLCFEGPDEQLTETVHAQIAIFVTSIAILRVLQLKIPDFRPAAVCGLSLGELSALVACQSLSFEEGTKLVFARGKLMQEAGVKNPGTMASIIGLSEQDCKTVGQKAGVAIANINAPDQIVLSGTKEGIAQACDLANQAGAKRAIVLKVGGAFHSPLMESAQTGLVDHLKNIKLDAPKTVFIPNVTGNAEGNANNIRDFLGRQVTQSVQWVKSIQTLRSLNVSRALEIGPGKVLKGLAKRIDPLLQVTSISSVKDVEDLLSQKVS